MPIIIHKRDIKLLSPLKNKNKIVVILNFWNKVNFRNNN